MTHPRSTALLLAALVSTAFVTLDRDARACTQEEGFQEGIEVRPEGSLRSVPHDGGVVVLLRFKGVEPADVVAKLAPVLTDATGATIPSTARVVDDTKLLDGHIAKLHVVPTTPLTPGQRVTLTTAKQGTTPEEEAPSFGFDVLALSLADFRLEGAALALGPEQLSSDFEGEKGRCILASGTSSRGGGSCGPDDSGPGPASNERMFAMRGRRERHLFLNLPSVDDEILRAYTSTVAAGAITTAPRRLFPGTQSFTTKTGGRTCVTLTRSFLSDVVPAVTREVCIDVPALAEVTPEEHADVRKQQLQGTTCSSVVYPDGTTDSQDSVGEVGREDGGCSVSPARGRSRSAGGLGLLGIALFATALVRRRAARSRPA